MTQSNRNLSGAIYQTRSGRLGKFHGNAEEGGVPSFGLTRKTRRRQNPRTRVPPRSKEMSPTLNSPSSAWSAKIGSRVFEVAGCHIGLTGRKVDGIPTTGIAPAFVSVTTALSINPHSIKRMPQRTNGDRTARATSHKIAKDSHSQITGCCIHASWCKVETKCIVPANAQWQRNQEQAKCQIESNTKSLHGNRMGGEWREGEIGLLAIHYNCPHFAMGSAERGEDIAKSSTETELPMHLEPVGRRQKIEYGPIHIQEIARWGTNFVQKFATYIPDRSMTRLHLAYRRKQRRLEQSPRRHS